MKNGFNLNQNVFLKFCLSNVFKSLSKSNSFPKTFG